MDNYLFLFAIPMPFHNIICWRLLGHRYKRGTTKALNDIPYSVCAYVSVSMSLIVRVCEHVCACACVCVSVSVCACVLWQEIYWHVAQFFKNLTCLMSPSLFPYKSKSNFGFHSWNVLTFHLETSTVRCSSTLCLFLYSFKWSS